MARQKTQNRERQKQKHQISIIMAKLALSPAVLCESDKLWFTGKGRRQTLAFSPHGTGLQRSRFLFNFRKKCYEC